MYRFLFTLFICVYLQASSTKEFIESTLTYKILGSYIYGTSTEKVLNFCIFDQKNFNIFKEERYQRFSGKKTINVVNGFEKGSIFCDVLFLGKDAHLSLKRVKRISRIKNSLIFTNKKKYKDLSHVYFQEYAGKVRFSVNRSLLKTSKIDLGAKMIRFAYEVY